MKRFVKVLLVILAALLIAAGSFWGGTRFGFRQMAANQSQSALSGAPSADAVQPGSNRQRGSGMMGSNAFNDRNGKDTQDSNRNWTGNRNFGPGMMSQNFQGNYGMMNRSTQGFSGMSFGGHLLGGGLLFLGLLFPLGFAILMVLGIILLFRMVRKPAVIPAASTIPCAKCGAALESGWKHCPQCGEPIK